MACLDIFVILGLWLIELWMMIFEKSISISWALTLKENIKIMIIFYTSDIEAGEFLTHTIKVS